jgi:hypothetical protein
MATLQRNASGKQPERAAREESLASGLGSLYVDQSIWAVLEIRIVQGLLLFNIGNRIVLGKLLAGFAGQGAFADQLWSLDDQKASACIQMI